MKSSRINLWGFYAVILLISLPGLSADAMAHPGVYQRLNYINQQLSAKPNTQALHLQRAWLWIMDKQFDRALADIIIAEKLDLPVKASYHKGILYTRLGQPEKAIPLLSQFIQYYPNDFSALQARAEAKYKVGDIASAIADYQQLLALTPYPNPGQYIAAANLSLNSYGYQSALKIVDQGIKKMGLIPQLQQYAIALEINHKNINLALARLETLKKTMINSPTWHLQKAELLIKNKQFPQAQDQLAQTEKLLLEYKPTPWLFEIAKNISKLRLNFLQ